MVLRRDQLYLFIYLCIPIYIIIIVAESALTIAHCLHRSHSASTIHDYLLLNTTYYDYEEWDDSLDKSLYNSLWTSLCTILSGQVSLCTILSGQSLHDSLWTSLCTILLTLLGRCTVGRFTLLRSFHVLSLES